MTEKHYGGASSRDVSPSTKNEKNMPNGSVSNQERKRREDEEESSELNSEIISKYKKAGKISTETIKYARAFIKHGMPLLEIAEKIEEKIIQLGVKPAFPVNLSINEVAAHATPIPGDDSKAYGLLKVDLGVQIDGYIADTAFSLDLENSEENKKLIHSAESALDEACKILNKPRKIREIGGIIEKTIKAAGFQPIQNLCGHSLEQNEIHAGVTLPNYDNAQEKVITPGAYAIEPFATTGLGKVRDGRLSTIYVLSKESNVRDSFAREVLAYIIEEYATLPFCLRWIHKKFGSRAVIAMKRLEDAGIVYQYPQLIESGNGKVAQAEHTLIITEKETIITTK